MVSHQRDSALPTVTSGNNNPLTNFSDLNTMPMDNSLTAYWLDIVITTGDNMVNVLTGGLLSVNNT
jgi:hypothetical protein